MNISRFLLDFVVVFAIAFLVAALASFLLSLVVHGSGVVDWEHAVRLGIIIAVILPLLKIWEKKRR